ncbi:hypothetical protein MO973_34625 [Paenibacillus sp. TRM 82003]|uniref:hypothetical protein n=1 Tax=Kineococcus sp. TRM81007 TaxID=2925831 RepID=UPI001F581704|nr:hypothetical protein [Kineococcus sp. TRM81007]MCI2240717.1 hypothetical protein [Kineococcus sp. TRM81007]MCI3925360.1 hypothetical protein [Paenibacillus sp. TRM 82003]
MTRTTAALVAAAGLVLTTGCSDQASDVAPPAPAGTPAVAAPGPVPGTASSPAAAGPWDGDPAAVAVRVYLREQALAVNARVADPARLPALRATLTTAALEWAVPLLAQNLGDEMPGPYPVGVLGSTREGQDRVVLQLCLQDRGWQVDRADGEPVNTARYSTATAVVLRVDGRWLVDDVASTSGACTAGDVVVERF